MLTNERSRLSTWAYNLDIFTMPIVDTAVPARSHSAAILRIALLLGSALSLRVSYRIATLVLVTSVLQNALGTAMIGFIVP